MKPLMPAMGTCGIMAAASSAVTMREESLGTKPGRQVTWESEERGGEVGDRTVLIAQSTVRRFREAEC